MCSKKSTGLVQQWLMSLISSIGAMPSRVGVNFMGDIVERREVTEVEDFIFDATNEEQNGSGGGEKGKRSQLWLPGLLNNDDILITQ